MFAMVIVGLPVGRARPLPAALGPSGRTECCGGCVGQPMAEGLAGVTGVQKRGVRNAGERRGPHRDTRGAQPSRVLVDLIADRVVLADGNDGRRQAGQVLGVPRGDVRRAPRVLPSGAHVGLPRRSHLGRARKAADRSLKRGRPALRIQRRVGEHLGPPAQASPRRQRRCGAGRATPASPRRPACHRHCRLRRPRARRRARRPSPSASPSRHRPAPPDSDAGVRADSRRRRRHARTAGRVAGTTRARRRPSRSSSCRRAPRPATRFAPADPTGR